MNEFLHAVQEFQALMLQHPWVIAAYGAFCFIVGAIFF